MAQWAVQACRTPAWGMCTPVWNKFSGTVLLVCQRIVSLFVIIREYIRSHYDVWRSLLINEENTKFICAEMSICHCHLNLQSTFTIFRLVFSLNSNYFEMPFDARKRNVSFDTTRPQSKLKYLTIALFFNRFLSVLISNQTCLFILLLLLL